MGVGQKVRVPHHRQRASSPTTIARQTTKAPPEIRGVVQNSMVEYSRAKEELIAKITANKACKFTPDFLRTKDVDELRGLAELAATPAPVENQQGGQQGQRPPMFVGQATPGQPPVQNKEGEGEAEEPLMAPTMNFEQSE